MSESKSASVVFTNGSLLAKNAQAVAGNAKTAAEEAQAAATGAQKTADGKNSVYRGSDPNTVPKTGLKEGDIYFADNALYTWNGSAWEKTVSDTTGAEIHEKVEKAMQESQKAVAELKTNVEEKASQIDKSLTNDLSAAKADLADTKKSLEKTASDLSSTKQSLADTGKKLETTVSDFQRETGKLSGSLSTANSKIEYNSKSIAEVKHTAEGISTTVSNMHAGDRNLASGVASSKDWCVFGGFNNLTNYGRNLVNYSLDTLKAGDTVTFGITMKNEGVTSGTMIIQQFGNVSLWNRDYSSISLTANVTDYVPNGTEKALTYTTTITDGMLNGNTSYTITARTDNIPAGGKLSFRYAFVKRGTLATDWTPAPEDTTQAISKISQTANSLTAYVKESRGSNTLASLLSMDPDNSTIGQVVNGHVVAAINTSSDGSVKIDGKALHISANTTIDQAVIHAANIDSIDASTIRTGTLNAAHVNVINLDANSITTRSLRAAINSVTDFKEHTVSPSSPWDFNLTKDTNGNWFLDGERTGKHLYNGPDDKNGHKLAPYMYVTSRGALDGRRVTVTVWKDDDPTQYQRTWIGDHWTPWVMLPNSQNLVSAINISPDSVKISGKNIELDGNTTVTGQLDLMRKNTNWVSQSSNYHNNWSWNNAHIYFNNYLQLLGENCNVTYTDDNSHLNGGKKFYSIGTLTPGYLKFTTYQDKVSAIGESFNGQIARTYIDSNRIETNDARAGNLRIVGHHIRATDDKFVLISNHAGTNFDNNGSVGFQVYGGIGLGKNTIYTPSDGDLYIQEGNACQNLGNSYSGAGKVNIHCGKVTSQWANTVSSRLSVKNDITKVTYDRALAAVEGTEMYDYRYINDYTGQHYVSGIIDDINPDPQYHMDGMLINKERTARIDANLVGYHHVVIQKLLDRVAALEEKAK